VESEVVWSAFDSRNIIYWLNDGRDVMVLLPYLSVCMGQSELTSTMYYNHLLPENLRSSAKINWNLLSPIYGKGCWKMRIKAKDPKRVALMGEFMRTYLSKVRSSQGIRRYWLLMLLAHLLACTGCGETMSFEDGYAYIYSYI
jgi:hypothetical protein